MQRRDSLATETRLHRTARLYRFDRRFLTYRKAQWSLQQETMIKRAALCGRSLSWGLLFIILPKSTLFFNCSTLQMPIPATGALHLFVLLDLVLFLMS